MQPHQIFQALYESEINCRVESFWDGGWVGSLGDEVNGFQVAKGAGSTLAECIGNLAGQACAVHPASVFAERYRAPSGTNVAQKLGEQAYLWQSDRPDPHALAGSICEFVDGLCGFLLTLKEYSSKISDELAFGHVPSDCPLLKWACLSPWLACEPFNPGPFGVLSS